MPTRCASRRLRGSGQRARPRQGPGGPSRDRVDGRLPGAGARPPRLHGAQALPRCRGLSGAGGHQRLRQPAPHRAPGASGDPVAARIFLPERDHPGPPHGQHRFRALEDVAGSPAGGDRRHAGPARSARRRDGGARGTAGDRCGHPVGPPDEPVDARARGPAARVRGADRRLWKGRARLRAARARGIGHGLGRPRRVDPPDTGELDLGRPGGNPDRGRERARHVALRAVHRCSCLRASAGRRARADVERGPHRCRGARGRARGGLPRTARERFKGAAGLRGGRPRRPGAAAGRARAGAARDAAGRRARRLDQRARARPWIWPSHAAAAGRCGARHALRQSDGPARCRRCRGSERERSGSRAEPGAAGSASLFDRGRRAVPGGGHLCGGECPRNGAIGLKQGDELPKFAAPSATGHIDKDANVSQDARARSPPARRSGSATSSAGRW